MQGNKKSYGSRFLESSSFIAGYRLFKKHLQMILRHEAIHIKRRDILYKTLVLLARAVHWF